LVGGNVTVISGVGNIVFAKGVEIHWHRIPAVTRNASYLSTVKVGLEARSVADVQNFVCYVESDLAGEE
jgi:hypothetical protein